MILLLILFLFMIVTGITLFVTSDRPFNLRGIIGFTLYTTGWMLGMLFLWP